MINIFGGGAQTNINGLFFEQATSLDATLSSIGYSIKSSDRIDGINEVWLKTNFIGYSTPKRKIYKFLQYKGIDYTTINSKGWEPDEAFINEGNHTVYIIEKKFQNGGGSVDEKLPGCDFKKKEYEKLFNPIGYNVVFIYVFNDWFMQPVYKDTLQYIASVNCLYCFNEIPIQWLGL